MPAPIADEVDSFLDARLGVAPSPVPSLGGRVVVKSFAEGDPEPSPSPSASASPDELITMVTQATGDIQATRVAASNGYFALGFIVCLLVVLVFQNAFRRGGR